MNENVPFMIDCYVRVSEAELLKLPLTHLESGVDADEDVDSTPDGYAAGGHVQVVRGFTECVSDSQPVVSVGWDWTLGGLQTPVLDPHSVRTNVMLVDNRQVDCSYQATIAAVIALIGRHAWQDVVMQTLRDPHTICRQIPPVARAPLRGGR